MANDDDRKRRRDREDEAEQEALSSKPGVEGRLMGTAPSEKIDELIKRAEPLIEQINNLYNQYIAGIEQRPPNERRKTLDQIMTTLQLVGKPTSTYQFRVNTLREHYNITRDRWDRLMRDLESGKLKRTVGPRSGR